MIDVKNRIPQPGKEGRVQLSPVAGLPNIFDLAMADDATENGAPWNRRTAQLLQADIRTLPIAAGNTVAAGDVVDVVGGEVVSGKYPIGTLAIGTVVMLPINGVPAEFIVAHHGKPSPIYSNTLDGATVLLMKGSYDNREWDTSNTNNYAGSSIHSHLNGAFLGLLGDSVRASILQVKIPYRPGSGYSTTVNSGENGLQAKVWLPSGYELGWTSANDPSFPADGAKFDCFLSGATTEANAKRASASIYWIRSPWCNSSGGTTRAFTVQPDGSHNGNIPCNTSRGIRPALALPDAFSDYSVSWTSQAIALQSGTAGQPIDIIFDGVAELPGFTAGTQIASSGVQGYAPQDGWLWVRPEWDNNEFYIVGSYTGNAVNTNREINIGFRPSLVTIQSDNIGGQGAGSMIISDTLYANSVVLQIGTNVLSGTGSIVTDNGFKLSSTPSSTPYGNVSGVVYKFMALVLRKG